MKKNILKILISYHKPYKLLKNKIYTPIHVGREIATQNSKDGKISQKDYKWLVKNLIGDNTGDNISSKNRELCELTAIYWAWKNYDKLNNPDYIGFMHYRRLLDFKFCKNDIEKFVQNYDMLIMKRAYLKSYKDNNYKQYKFSKYHHIEDLEKALKITEYLYPEYKTAIHNYLESNFAYFCNIFIMKKELFFNYCEWLFPIIYQLEKNIDLSKYGPQERRCIAYIAERLIGIYYTYMVSEKNIKTAEIPLLLEDNNSFYQRLKAIVRKLKPIYLQ